MPDFAALKRELLTHYVLMASNPGFKAHTWHRVKEMAEVFPELWGDLPELLTTEMNKRKEGT